MLGHRSQRARCVQPARDRVEPGDRGDEKRTLASSGNRSLHSGANTLNLALGGKLKAKLHKAKIKPTLTITLGDGTNVRQRVAL